MLPRCNPSKCASCLHSFQFVSSFTLEGEAFSHGSTWGGSQALNNGALFPRGLQTFLVVSVKFLGLKIEGPTTFGTDKLYLPQPRFPFVPSWPKENGSNFYCFLFKSPSWFSKFTSFTTFGHKFWKPSQKCVSAPWRGGSKNIPPRLVQRKLLNGVNLEFCKKKKQFCYFFVYITICSLFKDLELDRISITLKKYTI